MKYKIKDIVIFKSDSNILVYEENSGFTFNKEYTILKCERYKNLGLPYYLLYNDNNDQVWIFEDHLTLSTRKIRNEIIDEILS